MAATNIPLYPGPRFATELANTKELVWYAQAPDGAELGPVSKADIDQAARQNQMDANTLLWCEGWKSVKLAGELYPDFEQYRPSSPLLSSEKTPRVRRSLWPSLGPAR